LEPEDIPRYNEFMQELESLLQQNSEIKGFAKAPPVELNLLDRKPRWIHQYTIAEDHKQAVREQIKKWLERGKIKRSKSLWNLPLTTAIKRDKNGKQTGIRVCLDTRVINQKLIADKFTIPNVKEILNSLQGKKFFTEIDLEDAFLQLKLKTEDEPILSFTFDGVQYSFTGATYGLKIMSNVFQRTISNLLAGMDFAKIYIDNITIASKNWKEHKQHVRQVIEKLNSLNIKISQKKLLIGRRKIRILGQTNFGRWHKTRPCQGRKNNELAVPEKPKELASLLGSSKLPKTSHKTIC
jgi:hypothetical protein